MENKLGNLQKHVKSSSSSNQGGQNKRITKTYSAEVNAGVSTKLIQVRVTIFAIFCIQHEIFPHRWPPVVHPWPPQNV